MVSSDKPERLALYFVEECKYGSTNWVARVVRVVDHETRIMFNGRPAPTIRNLESDHPLEGLRAWTWPSKWDNEIRASIWVHEYRDLGGVGLAKAQAMVKVLSKIDKSMTKAYEEDGNAAHFGQFVMRLARILGISEVIVRQDANRPVQSSYDTDEYRVMPIGRASDWIAAEIKESIEQGRARTF